ncbi:Ester hydrolase C11orf54-like protein [Formica fusca]
MDLKKNFEDVTVHWTICPDLSQEPYNLAAKDICGETKFVEIGDKSYLDSAQTRKLFYLKDVVKHFSTEQSLIFGQSVSQCPGGNLGQMITNASFSKEDPEISINKSGIISAKSRKCNFKSVLNDDFGFNCTKHGTFFLCEGLNKPVLKVYATKYRSTVPAPSFTSFIDCMKKSIEEKYQPLQQLVVLGGVYIMENVSACKHKLDKNVWEPWYKPQRSHDYKYCKMNNTETIVTTFSSSSTERQYSPSCPVKFTCQFIQCLSHHNKVECQFLTGDGENIKYLGYFCPAEYVHYFDG